MTRFSDMAGGWFADVAPNDGCKFELGLTNQKGANCKTHRRSIVDGTLDSLHTCARRPPTGILSLQFMTPDLLLAGRLAGSVWASILQKQPG